MSFSKSLGNWWKATKDVAVEAYSGVASASRNVWPSNVTTDEQKIELIASVNKISFDEARELYEEHVKQQEADSAKEDFEKNIKG